MKIAVCFLYIALSILYLSPLADSSRIWGGVNIITQIGFIGYLCGQLQKKTTGNEQLLFEYLKWLSLANCVYICLCIYRESFWAVYNTGVFAYILGISFLIFIIHCALRP